MLKRTPCIGICSTTYGDLVCRGCKRFAHEIVQWNSFAENQREAVWQRLLSIREGAVRDVLSLDDEQMLRAGARSLHIREADESDPFNLAYEVLRRLQRHALDLAAVGLGIRTSAAADSDLEPTASALLRRIDREYYQRSMAYYERSFRTPAQ